MSLSAEISLVAKIELTDNTYYVTDRDGITLDGTDYQNLVIGWGVADFKGNLGAGTMQIGSFNMTLVNGETHQGAGYNLDPTDVWNNNKVTVKRCIVGTHTTFAGCQDYILGIIKDYQIEQDKISFKLDAGDRRDDKLIPGVIGLDQTTLTDAEAQTSFLNLVGNLNAIRPSSTTIWNAGELVKLIAPSGEFEYIRIEKVDDEGAGSLIFYSDKINNAKYTNDYNNIVEKAFRNIPTEFVGKAVPIQIGNLDKEKLGVFGKTFTTSERIGEQAIICDSAKINNMNNIGSWETGLRRYFVGKSENEYKINNNLVEFKVDSTATLSSDIVSTSEGIESIVVSDYEPIAWDDEDSVYKPNTYPEILGINIIAIDRELMMLVEKPTSNTIFVERGYNDTEITTHDSGATIFQSARYSAKNLLSFTERFESVSAANYNKHTLFVVQSGGVSEAKLGDSFVNGNFLDTNEVFNVSADGTGKISNVFDGDPDTYMMISYGTKTNYISPYAAFSSQTNMDFKFPKFESDFTVVSLYSGLRYRLRIYDFTFDDTKEANQYCYIALGLMDPDGETSPDEDLVNDYPSVTPPNYSVNINELQVTATIGSTSPLESEKNIDGHSNLSSTDTGRLEKNVNFALPGGAFEETLGITTTKLTDLNKKYKFGFVAMMESGVGTDVTTAKVECRLYNVALWVDMFINFTTQTVISSLNGREITAESGSITGATSPDVVGDTAENIVDVLSLLLNQELRYRNDVIFDFVTDSWQTVKDYTSTSTNYEILSPLDPTPETAFSIGIDDKQKRGWDFCSELASHFNLQIVKDYAGLVDIVNLHEIYNSTPTGNEIKIEDITFIEGSGNRELTVMQTGTDLIYNDIMVKWKRNNSTGDYQEVYTLPDSYTLVKSLITLKTARTNYYGGEKRTLTIESPYIYNEADAKRLAEWKADDQAEVHFFIDFNIDYDHYTDRNSLSNQYKIGDIMYLNGDHGGILFNSSRKFYMQNIKLMDGGRKVKIQAKSVDPVSSFTKV
jgi:hypothetical protein